MLLNNLIHKKVLIWGLGREGTSILRLIKERNIDCDLTVFSDNPFSENQLTLLKDYKGLKHKNGELTDNFLQSFDIVIKTPGVSIYRKDIIAAKEKGVKFTGGTNIAFAEIRKNFPAAKIICITGTKGKSTTSSLIAHFLRSLGFKTALGGNIGVPLVEFIKDTPKKDYFDYIVAEISSYQASDIEYSPDAGILLNLYPEHFDWHLSHENYYSDKINLFKNRKNNAPLILNYTNKRAMEYCKGMQDIIYYNHKEGLHLSEGFICDGFKRLFQEKDIKIIGTHNHENICAALSIIKYLGKDISQCLETLKFFEGLKHRLQILGQKHGITFINDSISTAPETAIAAINCFSNQPITLICGGYERHQDYNELALVIKERNIPCVITLGATGKRIFETLKNISPQTNVKEAADLKSAVRQAVANSSKGSIILLSPAAPSYGVYNNFEERGEDFINLFKEL